MRKSAFLVYDYGGGVEFLKTLFIMIVRTIDIRLEPLCERTSGVINKLVLSTGLRRLEILSRKNLLRILCEKREIYKSGKEPFFYRKVF